MYSLQLALSMSVLLFWGAFFETPRKSPSQQTNQNIEKKTEQGINYSNYNST